MTEVTLKVRYTGGPRDGKTGDLIAYRPADRLDAKPGAIGCHDEYVRAGMEAGVYHCKGLAEDGVWDYQWRLVSEVRDVMVQPKKVHLPKTKR